VSAAIGELRDVGVANSWRARPTRASRVTVINDDPEFLALMGDIFSGDHFAATLLDEDGPDVLERASESKPDLLMIDLRSCADRVDGWKIARTLRRDPELARLPILVCSGDYQAMSQLADQAANDTRLEFLRKPFGLDQLTDAIARLLGRHGIGHGMVSSSRARSDSADRVDGWPGGEAVPTR
jgi:twitching motility two-component system response regulator PilH